MRRSLPASLLFCLIASTTWADDPKLTIRPISEADSVLAVFREDWGLASSGGPAIILAVWPDGHIVWSRDRLKVGAPYQSGKIPPKEVTALLERFAKDGLFSHKKLNQAQFGPDSQFHTVLVKSGKQQVKMQSWHELDEDLGAIVDERGSGSGTGRVRLNVLREASADYLFFRFVWAETRAKLTDLIPDESSASYGKPVMNAGILSWQEPAAIPKSIKAN